MCRLRALVQDGDGNRTGGEGRIRSPGFAFGFLVLREVALC